MNDDRFLETMREDLIQWRIEEGQPTDGIEVLAAVPILGGEPEYAAVLYRDGDGVVHSWTARQYRKTWTDEDLVRELAVRVRTYERLAVNTRAFLERMHREDLVDEVIVPWGSGDVWADLGLLNPEDNDG